jgi:lactate racemase
VGVHKVNLTVNAYFEEELEITFPSNWDVAECRMAGHDRPGLSDDEMRRAIQNPIGSPRLRDLAQGKQRVVILFDDTPKPTPTNRIAPFVLEELHAGGIQDDQIRFLCAPGTHRPLSAHEFVAKLGANIVSRYPVYNHSVYENLVEVGTTSRGTVVKVNREYMSCDLRVAIGSIIPHQMAGYGAGGKIILPGISGMDTIEYHHQLMKKEPYFSTAGVGKMDGNQFRLDIEEAARLADLHFKVDVVLNNRRDVVGLFAGEFVAEHRVGVKLAREVYHTDMVRDVDVLVTNAYPDEHQYNRAVWLTPRCLKEGGDLVIVGWNREGQTVHQFSSRFGTEFGGRGWNDGAKAKPLARAARVFILAPFLAQSDRMEWGADRVVWCRSWGEVLGHLAERHGQGTKVAVYPYTPLQVED